MTAKPFDRFNKRLFQELLSPFGQVIPNMAVIGDERMINIFFAPHYQILPNEEELGSLVRIMERPALLEPYRSALVDDDVQTCLRKLFMVFADLQRQNPTVIVTAPPKLWILAAEVSDRLLQDFKADPNPELGDGFYDMGKGLQTTIVRLNELPNVPETLWLRLLAKGRVQEDAIEELLLLPESDPKRRMALGLLVSWRINIELADQVDIEERQILMALSQTYLEWEKQTKREGLEQGLEQGSVLATRSAIGSLLRFRFGAIDTALEGVVPRLMALSSDDYTRFILESSKDELTQRFGIED